MTYRIFLWTACLGLSCNVAVAEVTSNIGLGAGHSDNIRRTQENQQDETIGSLDLDFSWTQDSRTLHANVLADLAYLKYFQDTYDAELVGSVNALTTFRIVPERFEWVVNDNFGQVRNDPFMPATPDNRENINYFTTGPDFGMRFGSTMRARVSGRYSRSDYETSLADSDRYGASVAVIREFSTASNLSLNVGSEKIDYAEPAITDFDRRQAYLSYQLEGARTEVSIDVGATQIRRETDNRDGALVRLDVSRRLSPAATLTLRGGRELTDAADVFRLEQGMASPSLDAQSSPQVSAPFVNEYVGLGWEFLRGRTGFGLSATRFSENYEEPSSLSDRVRWLGEAHASRQISPLAQVRIGANFLKVDHDSPVLSGVGASNDYREIGGSAMLVWRATPKLSANFEYQYFTSRTQDGLSEYAENRIWVRFTYAIR